MPTIDILKYESSETMEEMDLVDPYAVQPVTEYRHHHYYDQESNSALSVTHEDSGLSAGEPIKMEHYVNLDLILTPLDDDNLIFSDELNTPVFGAAKALHNALQNIQSVEQNPFYFPSSRIKSETRVGAAITTTNTNNTTNAAVGNETMLDLADNSVVSSEAGLMPAGDFNILDDDINLDDYDLLSDYRDAPIFTECMTDRDANYFNYDSTLIHTDNKRDVHISIGTEHNYPLKLNINDFNILQTDVQTPEVINAIFAIENDFGGTPTKIEAEIISADDLLDSHPTPSNSPLVYSPPEAPRKAARRKHQQRPVTSDDDEDYVPPSRKRSRRASTSSEESEDDESPAKRGRPAKKSRAPPTKYREMRDKNNEASRRSRQKRKDIEKVHEGERQILEENNLRLKARVAELEESVRKFRSDMMMLMLNK